MDSAVKLPETFDRRNQHLEREWFPSKGRHQPIFVLPGPFHHDQGFAWCARLSGYQYLANNFGSETQSPVILLEDGISLGPPHASCQDLRTRGAGLYSHWYDTLYFSTSDNSDPNHNGRKYQIVFDDHKLTEVEDNLLQERSKNTINLEIINNLGLLAALRQDFPKAIKYFKECLEISPFYLPAAINYADVLKSLNLLYTALPVFEKLKEKYPHNSDVASYLEECRLGKGLKCFSDIHRKVSRGLPADPKLLELGGLYLNLIIHNCLLGELGQKISALNRISMLHPEVLCLLLIFSKYRPGNVLEIGPYIGGSTIALALGKQAAGSTAKIISIEAGGKYLEHPDIPSNDIIGDLKDNLDKFAVADRVEILEGFSHKEGILKKAAALLHESKNKAGVFFIDADGNIMRDINNYKRFLAADCILVVDDYSAPEYNAKVPLTKKEIDTLKAQDFIIEFGVYGWGTWMGQFNERKFHELDAYLENLLPGSDFGFEGCYSCVPQIKLH